MIKTWTLEKFKSVYEKTTLEMSPLTIFSGANSSGKSTLIQSLLLTAQTLQSPVHSRAVVLNGHIVRLGTFNDIVSDSEDINSILIGFELTPISTDFNNPIINLNSNYYMRNRNITDEISSIDCTYTFSSHGPTEKNEVLQLQPCLEECNVKVKRTSEGKILEDEISICRSQKEIAERASYYKLNEKNIQRAEMTSLKYEVIKPKKIDSMRRYIHLRSSCQPAGISLVHFLPERISIVFDAVEEDSKRLVEMFVMLDQYRYRDIDLTEDNLKVLNDEFKNIVKNTVISFITEYVSSHEQNDIMKKRLLDVCRTFDNDFSTKNLQSCYIALPPSVRQLLLQKLFDQYDILLKSIKADRLPEYTIAYVPLSTVSDLAITYTQQFFTHMVKYLGPLRDEPKPLYPLSGATDTKDIGFKGEHTAAVLNLYKDMNIQYIPCQQFKENIATPIPQTATLIEAVLDWLDYMGVASKIHTIDKGKLGHEMKVTIPGASHLHDLTHVGVGVSQVLPILVQSLLAEQGSTLIFEQPELHLHPRVQTRLADFFISMTLLRKQCIVETHSEYLINRLRYLAILSEGSEIADNVMIYFTEKDSNHTKYEPIKINQFGGVSSWPKGFFDESEEIARQILKRALNKRKNGVNK